MKANINVRIDNDIKTEANGILKAMGLDMSTAINMFIRQIVTTRSFPFKPRLEYLRPSITEYLEDIENGKETMNEIDSIEDLIELCKKSC